MGLMLALAITLVAAPLVSEEGAAQPGSLAAAPTSCTAKGGQVTLGGRTTSTYSIDLSAGVTCAFAKLWVTRLSSKPVDPTSGEIAGGPVGWYCQRGGRPEKRAEVGSCSRNTATKSFFFSWQPSLPAPEGCSTNGARVKLRGHAPSTTYAIYELHGVTCAFAKPWVTRLSHMRVDPTTRRISGGPAGWACFGGGSEKRATLGSCANHTGAKRFYWDVAFAAK